MTGKQLPGPSGGEGLEAALQARLRHDDEPVTAGGYAAAEAGNSDGLDSGVLGRWRWQLGATARKAYAAQTRAAGAVTEWERLVADARAAGVPERLIVAAAADAGVEIPQDTPAR